MHTFSPLALCGTSSGVCVQVWRPKWTPAAPHNIPAARLNTSKGPLKSDTLRKVFCNMWKLSEIAFLTSRMSNFVCRNARKCRKFSRELSADPWSAECTSDLPLHCTLLIQFLQFGFFSLFVAHCRSGQSFEPTISLPNSHATCAHNQAMAKQHCEQYCKTSFAKFPLLSAADTCYCEGLLPNYCGTNIICLGVQNYFCHTSLSEINSPKIFCRFRFRIYTHWDGWYFAFMFT